MNPSTGANVPGEILQQIPMFQNLTAEECLQVAAVGTVVVYQPGEVIIKQGKQSQNLWIVLEGQCEVVKERGEGPSKEEYVLATLSEHSNFGEMSFFQQAEHSASVRAKTTVRLLRIRREDYDALIDGDVWAAYKMSYNAVESLAERLRRMDEWVAQLLRENANRGRVQEWSQFRQKLFKEWTL